MKFTCTKKKGFIKKKKKHIKSTNGNLNRHEQEYRFLFLSSNTESFSLAVLYYACLYGLLSLSL